LQAILEGDPKTGYPIIIPGDKVPDPSMVYDCENSSPSYLPHSLTPNKQLPFVRHQSCLLATLACKNRNMYPVKVKAVDMPGGKAWNNLALVDNTWHHHYCAAEGLCKTSDEARLPACLLAC